jgi:hypothetical protein
MCIGSILGQGGGSSHFFGCWCWCWWWWWGGWVNILFIAFLMYNFPQKNGGGGHDLEVGGGGTTLLHV